MERWRTVAGRAAQILRLYEEKSEREAFVADERCAATTVEDIAWQCFELEVIDDPSLEEGVLGELDLDAGTIGVRPGLAAGRRAFTIAHELGHAALMHPPNIVGYERRIPDTDVSIDERVGPDELEVQDGVYQAYNARDLMEIEANLFAAELLVPTESVLAATREEPRWTAKGLAERFGVSETTMLTQLSNTLLLRRGAASGAEDEPLEARGEDEESVTDNETPILRLDPKQSEAATAETPALVLAGPGAGKTRVLAERFAHLVRTGVPADSVLALTFSNKAAEEMRRRVTGMLGEEHDGNVRVFTFHAFCLDILKHYGRWIDLPEGFLLATEMDTALIMRRRLCELDLSHLEELSDPGLYVPTILNAISRAKDELRTPEEFESLARAWSEAADDDDAERETAGKALEAARVYAAYQDWLKADNRVDYGDLISLAIRVLDLPGVRDEIRERYEHVLVDEFQDINFASGRLLKTLDGGRGIVWAVADPDQSIYHFRGASAANLDRFGDDYPGFRLIRLDRNYRSVPDVVGICHGLRGGLEAAGEKEGAPPPLKAVRSASEEPAVSLVVTPDGEAELDYLVKQISDRVKRGISPGDQAVLCTSNAQARKVADHLIAGGVSAQGPASLLGGGEIKDALATLALLRGGEASYAALFRIARSDDNPLTEAETSGFLQWSRKQDMSVKEAMGRCGEANDLSAPSVEYLEGLHGLLSELPTWGDAWHALLEYAFHPNSRLRALFSDVSDGAGRRLSQVGQLAVLARSFADREGLVDEERIGGFLEYVREVAGSEKGGGVLHTPPVEDAVQVMTVHKSKGLEFPVVYVPYLAKGSFPVRGGGAETRLPPGLTRDDRERNTEDEDRCLFYVALTRAEDELVLSRAEYYGRAAKVLPLIDSLVREKDDRAMVVETRWEPTDDSAFDSSPTDPGIPAPASPEAATNVYHLWQLDSYDRCPLQAGYAMLSGIPNRRSAYQDFRDCVYRVMGDMQVLARESGENPDLDWTMERLGEVWEEEGPTGYFYEPAYRRRAEQIVGTWQASRGSVDWSVREGLSASVADRIQFEVRADAIRRESDGKIVVARHRFGRPRKSHKDGRNANRHALYVVAARQIWPDTPVEVVLHYLPRDEMVDATPTERVIQNRLDKLSGYARKIEEGIFPPKPSSRECMKCPWNLICPASA